MEEIKCGIEIHQQIDSHKLFCNCPSILRNDAPLLEVKRKLHAVKGESGEIDIAAKYEAERDREFIYQAYDSTCLVELDEEPPHLINNDALLTALHVALYLNCEILPISQIMRKTVVDGSNTSGFQRTVLIARNGWIETKFGKVGIDGINIEEDSARILGDKEEVKENNSIVKYSLDRLGIPLIEIQTKPDIKSAEQCKEVALFIGDVLRSCKVKRGIGTIRQDVNVSIKGHPRIEIKGFQDPKIFVSTINNEVLRQKKLIEINQELIKRKAKVDETVHDLTSVFKETKCNLIKKAIESNGKVLGIRLENFNGLLGVEFYSGRRFGSEISDYSKSSGVKGIIHSDEDLNKYSLSENEIKEINNVLKINDNDAFIIIADEANKTKKAIELAIKRAKIQLEHPSLSEVRKDNPDATTRFLRPMPGASRMYPETDLPLLRINRELINKAKETLPKLRTEISGELKEKGLSDEMVKLLTQGDKIEDFQSLLNLYNDPNFIVKALFLLPKEIASHEKISNEKINEILNLDIIESIIEAVSKDKINPEDVKHVMEKIVKGERFEDAIKLEKSDVGEIESEILKLVKEKPGLSIGGYMGLIMQKFKGKISGKEATEILEKVLGKK